MMKRDSSREEGEGLIVEGRGERVIKGGSKVVRRVRKNIIQLIGGGENVVEGNHRRVKGEEVSLD